jgi:hypothetical protein
MFEEKGVMNKTVKFSDEKTIILIPYEDRKGEWMTMALDRYRFKRRIHHVSKVVSPVLEKHLQIIRRHGELSHTQNAEGHILHDL